MLKIAKTVHFLSYDWLRRKKKKKKKDKEEERRKKINKIENFKFGFLDHVKG